MFYNKKEFLDIMKSLNHSDVVYDKDNIAIVEVGSFDDCRELFGNWYGVHWCIANKKCHWDSYIGEKPFSHQYFLLDFNKMNSFDKREANEAFVGFTFVCGGVTAAHAKNDADLMPNEQKEFRRILREKGVYNFVDKKLSTGIRGFVSSCVLLISIFVLLVYALSIALGKGGSKEETNDEIG